MVNKGFLFATSSWKIKSHVVASQITLFVWSCLNHLQKNIAQLIASSFLMIQSVNLTDLVQHLRLLPRHICCLVSASAKRNDVIIKSLGTLKNMSPRIKYIFAQERKAMFRLIKSYFRLTHNFQTWFHNADILLCYPQMSVFWFHTFLFSYISFSEMEHRNNVNLFLFI